jgi:hypothetical protein
MAFWRNPEGMASLFKTSGQARALCVFLALAAAGAARAEDPSFPAPPVTKVSCRPVPSSTVFSMAAARSLKV